MTVTLGGVVLSDHLVLEGLESGPIIAHSMHYTLGGSAVVQSDDNDDTVGRPLRLTGKNHFTLQQIQDVRMLRGQTVSLIHHRGTFDVIIIDTPVDPTINYADPIADDWYSGEITMITV